MKRLERLRATLTPKRWPVRWRLASVSAVLTFLILVIFALVVGRLTVEPAARLTSTRTFRARRSRRPRHTHLSIDAFTGTLTQRLRNVTAP